MSPGTIKFLTSWPAAILIATAITAISLIWTRRSGQMWSIVFEKDVGGGVTMRWHVTSAMKKRQAKKYLERLLASGNICETDNPDSPIRKVEMVDADGVVSTVFSFDSSDFPDGGYEAV